MKLNNINFAGDFQPLGSAQISIIIVEWKKIKKIILKVDCLSMHQQNKIKIKLKKNPKIKLKTQFIYTRSLSIIEAYQISIFYAYLFI